MRAAVAPRAAAARTQRLSRRLSVRKLAGTHEEPSLAGLASVCRAGSVAQHTHTTKTYVRA
eukprot:6190740-Pleurochrysis_carterae.AAC.3